MLDNLPGKQLQPCEKCGAMCCNSTRWQPIQQITLLAGCSKGIPWFVGLTAAPTSPEVPPALPEHPLLPPPTASAAFPPPAFSPLSWCLMLLVKTEVYQVVLPPVLWISFNLDELCIIENFVQETIQRHYSLSYVYISLVCVVFFFHKIQSKHTYVVKNTEENR